MTRRNTPNVPDVGETLANLLCLPVEGEAPESRRGYLPDRGVKGAAALVDSSGILDMLTAWRAADTGKPAPVPGGKRGAGRPGSLNDRAVLVVLLALVFAGEAPLITRVSEALTSRLHSPMRDMLGLDRVPDARTVAAAYHRAYRAVRGIVSLLDPYPGPRNRRLSRTELAELQTTWDEATVAERKSRVTSITNALLEASFQTLPAEVRVRWKGNLCVDATLVRTWGRKGTPSDKTTPASPDYENGWYSRAENHAEGDGRDKVAWGVEAHLAVMTANDPTVEPDFPLLVLGMSVDKPAGRVGENAVTAVSSIAHRGHPTGTCVADRAYFPSARPEKYQLPLRALGYSLVGDYRIDQLGIQGQHAGALLIEGGFYSPSIPQDLIDATRDYRNGLIDQDTYAARIEQRRQYAFRRKDGDAYSCPARGPGATASCPIVDAQQPRSGPVPVTLSTTKTRVLNPPEQPDRCCTNKSSVNLPLFVVNDKGEEVPTNAAKYAQDLPYGTPEWKATYATLRNTIEGFNGFIKDANGEALEEPGRRRARGYGIQSLFIACLVTAANLRKIAAFLSRVAAPAPAPSPDPNTGKRGRGRPKKKGLAAYLPTAPNAPPAQAPAA